VLNSLGVRRDAGAVELLTKHLSHADAQVASAAAVALGHIPNADASAALAAALGTTTGEVKNAVAEGCILTAERLAKSDRAAALALYTNVRQADVPAQRKLEATRGAILSAPAEEGLALLREQLHSPDKANQRLALTVLRESAGDTVDAALLDDVAKLPADRAALLVNALADRRETVRLPGLLGLMNSGAKPVQLAAIRAVGRVGNDTCLTALLGVVATQTDADLRQAAEGALAELPGEGVNAAVVSQLSKGDETLKPVLLGVIARRRIPAVDEVLKSLKGAKPAVRQAGLAALGATVELDRFPVLIDEVVKAPATDEAAVTALKTAAVRMPDREGCAGLLAAALTKAPAEAKGTLIETLAAVGGTKALNTLAGAARGTDPQLQDLSTRHLGEWMTADAAPVLLDLTKSAPGEKFQVRALRGYIRIARQFVLPEPERLQMCEQALAAAKQPAEQKMVLDVLKRYPSLGGLKLAIATGKGAGAKNAGLRDDAQAAALAITAKLGTQAPEAKKLLEQLDLGKVKLEIVKATYGAGNNVKDVTAQVQKAAGGLPLVTLPNENYNAAFGGDPAPGTTKQLKVQYKLNDKAGEATFAENALIVLPVPK
jgi:HEAT repeat protein